MRVNAFSYPGTTAPSIIRPSVERFAGSKPRNLSEQQLRDLAKQTQCRSVGDNSISGRTYYTLKTDFPLISKQAKTIQAMLGRHPAGYDFFGFHSAKEEDGKYVNTWSCSNNCD